MNSLRITLIALAITALAAAALIAHDHSPADEQKLVAHLQGVVKHLVEGTGKDSSSAAIDIEAYVIDGLSYESLIEAARGRSEKCRLIEGADTKMLFEQLTIADDQSAAYLVLKTRSAGYGERFHSVVFFKDARDGWKIRSWHISR